MQCNYTVEMAAALLLCTDFHCTSLNPHCKLNINTKWHFHLLRGVSGKTRKCRESLYMCQSIWEKTGVSKWGILYLIYITSYLTIPFRRGETPNNHFIKKCYTNKHELTGEGSSWLLPWYSTHWWKNYSGSQHILTIFSSHFSWLESLNTCNG